MRLLLDTHIFLWFVEGSSKLADAHREAIQNPANDAYLSVVSAWEATIKFQLGKLPLPEPPLSYFPSRRASHRIVSLELTEAAEQRLTGLPPIHRDPFDRMLVCQALEHGLTLVTDDPKIGFYAAPVLSP